MPIEVEVKSTHNRWRLGERFNVWFNDRFEAMLRIYDRLIGVTLRHPVLVLMSFAVVFVAALGLFPRIGFSFFPRTDAGMFTINVKAPSGSRISVTEGEIARVESLIRKIVSPEDLDLIVSNIGATPDFSAIYTSNSASHTATVQVGLKEDHKTGSYDYMARVKARLSEEMPELNTYFQSGGMVDAVVNLGLPAPIDVQIAGSNMAAAHDTARELATEIQKIPGVADVYIPQDVDYPALKLDIDRTRASELGLDQQEVLGNVITALTSNTMIAPSYWVDPKSGQDYMLTVQYNEGQVKSLEDLRAIPLRAAGSKEPARLDAITTIHHVQSPTKWTITRSAALPTSMCGLSASRLGGSPTASIS